MKKHGPSVKRKRKSPILFCSVMGLKSIFSLAGLQTTITRFNMPGLLYIKTRREMSSSKGQRNKGKKEEERDEQSEDKK